MLLSLREKCPNAEVFLVRIFPHLGWMRRDTSYLSIFSLNAGKYRPEKPPYLDTFHAVSIRQIELFMVKLRKFTFNHHLFLYLTLWYVAPWHFFEIWRVFFEGIETDQWGHSVLEIFKTQATQSFFYSFVFFVDISSYKHFKKLFYVTGYGQDARVAYVFNLKISETFP